MGNALLCVRRLVDWNCVCLKRGNLGELIKKKISVNCLSWEDRERVRLSFVGEKLFFFSQINRDIAV